MTEIITAVYKNGVLAPLQHTALQEGQKVRLQIVPPRVCITADTARRKVVRFLLDEVNYLLRGEQPALIEADQLVWRIPITLTYPTHGVVGQVGFIDVDAESGNLLLTAETIPEIKQNVHTVAASLASPTTSPG